MMSTSPIDIVQTVYDALSRTDLHTVLAMCAPDVVIVQDPALPWGGRFVGTAGVTAFVTTLSATIESSVEAEQLFQAGDRVIQYGRTRGNVRTNRASFDIAECHLWTINDGLVQSAEFFIDTPAMLAALGLPRSTN